MKILLATVFISVFVLGCNLLGEDTSPKFPECAGIKEKLNPYQISNAYSGKIWGDDTLFYTQFIFTEYVNYNYLLSAERSFNMSIKFTKGTTTIYQGSYCFYNFQDQKWYSQSGFDYRGKYTSWNFKFETFDCSALSGSCQVVRPEIQDTLIYHFEGTR